MKNDSGKNFHYMGLYTFSYMALGVLTPLISQYLAHIGFSGSQIGIVTSCGTLCGICGSLFWGRIYANMANKHILVIGLCLSAGAMALSNSLVTLFFPFLAGFGIMYFFQAPVMPLSDALTLDDGKSFSKARTWGAAGFAVAVLVTGYISDAAGLVCIFYIYAFCFICAALFIYSAYTERRKHDLTSTFVPPGGFRRRYRDLFHNRRLWQLIACAFFMGGTNVANNTYFGFLYTQGGGTVAGIGIAFFLMAGSEAPFMALSDKLDKKFTMEKMILIAMAVSVARFCWYGTSPSWVLLLSTFILQGFVNGIILVEFVRYVSKLVPESHSGIAISAYYIIASNCSTILCQFVGGLLLDLSGPDGIYTFFGFFNLAGLILYLAFGLYRPKDDTADRIIQ